ncbi:hypothetical protein IWQ61_004168 [Dispira simplex]|nr:hypothetical protein IWQ61_004168 [Dispira simplex]
MPHHQSSTPQTHSHHATRHTTTSDSHRSEALYDFNSTRFEPKRYATALLKDQPLTAVLQQANRLNQEIRQLDGDMKTLVYENYSKFIRATETIGKMKTDVVDMDAEMVKLQEKVNTLHTQSALAHSVFHKGTAKIKQLGAAHRMLCKLQTLFDLPDQLRQCWIKQDWELATQHYLRAVPLFQHYGKLSLFNSIESKCMAIITDIRESLWRDIAVKTTSEPCDSSDPLPAHLLPHLVNYPGVHPMLSVSTVPSGPHLAAQDHLDKIRRVIRASRLLVLLDPSTVTTRWETVLQVLLGDLGALFQALVLNLQYHGVDDWTFLTLQTLNTLGAQLSDEHTAILTAPLPSVVPGLVTITEDSDASTGSVSHSGDSQASFPRMESLQDQQDGDATLDSSLATLLLTKLALMTNFIRSYLYTVAQIIDGFSHCFLRASADHASVQGDDPRMLDHHRTTSLIKPEGQENAWLALSQGIAKAIDSFTKYLADLLTTPSAMPSANTDASTASSNPALPNLAHLRSQQRTIPALFHCRLLHILDEELARHEVLRSFARLNTVMGDLVTHCMDGWVHALFAAHTREFCTLLRSALNQPWIAKHSSADPTGSRRGILGQPLDDFGEALTMGCGTSTKSEETMECIFSVRNPNIISPLTPSSATGLPHTVSESSGAISLDPTSSLNSLGTESLPLGLPSQSAGVPVLHDPSVPLRGPALVTLLEQLEQWFIRTLEVEVCPTLQNLLQIDLNFDTQDQGKVTLLKRFELGLGAFLERLPATLIDLIITPGLCIHQPGVLLTMTKLCQDFQTGIIDRIYQTFSVSLLPSTDWALDKSGLNIKFGQTIRPLSPGVARQSFGYDPKRISVVWNHGAQTIANRYVVLTVRALARLVRKEWSNKTDVEQSNSVATPQRVSPIWLDLAGRWLPYVENDVVTVLGHPNATSRKSSSDITEPLRSLGRSAGYPRRSLTRTTSRPKPTGSIDPPASIGPPGRSNNTTATTTTNAPPAATASAIITAEGPSMVTLTRIPSLTLNPIHRSYSTDSSRHDSLGSNPTARSRHPSLTTTYTHPKHLGYGYTQRPTLLSSGITAAVHGEPPGSFSPQHISRSLSHTESALSQAQPPLHTPGTHSMTQRTFSSLDPVQRHLISHIDKLFSDRLEVFGNTPLDPTGLLVAIHRAIVKELIELVRLKTMSRWEVQQTQIDAFFLRTVWFNLINKDWVLASLLDEWLASAMARSADPTPLEESVVWDIVNTTLSQWESVEGLGTL